MIVGGHIHTSDLRLPVSKNHTSLKLPIVMAPGLTGDYLNNPGYTMLEFTIHTKNITVDPVPPQPTPE
jgi:hypothetical protein